MNRVDFRDQIAKNKRESFVLLVIIALVLVLIGYIIGRAFGEGYMFIVLIIAIVFSLSYVLIGFYNSGSIAIASVGAVLANKQRYHDLYNLVEGLTVASGLPMPKIYVMNSNQINAFASGRDPKNAVICVTNGAIEKLERRELEGVLAHELSHIANYDIRYMTLVTVLVGMISIVSEIFLRSMWLKNSDNNKNNGIFIILGLVLAILAPIVVYFVQLSISRKREYSADASAVKFTRYPEGLIGALKKIKEDSVQEKKVNKAVAPLFFSNPFKGLDSTHPPIEERIKMLEKM